MSAINDIQRGSGFGRRKKDAGATTVEFAFIATIFFTVTFGIVEFSRAMYIFNTLNEVTRQAARAAANISFVDGSALDVARKQAILNVVNGKLPFGSPITYENIRIEYLYLPQKAISLVAIPSGSLPNSPARNRLNCLSNPNAITCIRAVQARVCAEKTDTGNCTAVAFQSLVSLINLSLALPTSPTIVSAESLGYKPGDAP
jgi:hypothetical protein